jgi:hypothetical protein
MTKFLKHVSRFDSKRFNGGLILLLLCLSVPCLAQDAAMAKPDFSKNSDLTSFLLRTDNVLSRMADNCKNILITRSGGKNERRTHIESFEMKGYCDTKNNPEEDLDCPGYNIDAIGTIENRLHATVRGVNLTLVCGS